MTIPYASRRNYFRSYIPNITKEVIEKLIEDGRLNLPRQYLTAFPKGLCSFSGLHSLDLYNNKILKLPESIDNFANLQYFRIDNNQLKELPESFGNLKTLETLILSNNRFTAFPQQIVKLTNLVSLKLSRNQIKKIPTWIENLSNLKYLDLRTNQLTDLSDSFGNLKNLKQLDLQENQISELPDSFNKLKELELLRLNDNRFKVLSESIGFLKSLTELDLYNNKIATLPESMTGLVNLQLLNLENNKFSTIPDVICTLTQLQGLSFAENQLTTLPESFSSLENLSVLHLQKNRFVTLSETIGRLTKISRLVLSRNKLAALPESIGNLQRLGKLEIQKNPNLRELPLSLGECPLLTSLTIKGTQINRESVNRILDLCKAKRNKDILTSLQPRLELWKSYAKNKRSTEYDFAFVDELDEEKKFTIHEWLLRLSKARDFHLNQEPLAKTACAMLQDLNNNNNNWAEIFYIQAEANNTACEDRAAQAFNELYTAWRLHKINHNTPLQKKLAVIASAAKTFCLRKALANLLADKNERESVEIYLYYETTLQHKLDLLTAIRNMRYSKIGKRNWIDTKALEKLVRQNYPAEMAEIDITLKVAKEDKNFQAELKQIETTMYDKLNHFNMSDQEYLKHCNQLMKEKESIEKALLLNWVKAKCMSRN